MNLRVFCDSGCVLATASDKVATSLARLAAFVYLGRVQKIFENRWPFFFSRSSSFPVNMEKQAGEAKAGKGIRRLNGLEPLPEITHAKGRLNAKALKSAVLFETPTRQSASLPGSVEERSAEEIPRTDLLPSAESTSGISTAAGNASISSGTRDQHPLDPSPSRILSKTGMHSKDNEHQGAWMDQGRELPAPETSGHASENHRQFLHTRKPHNRDTYMANAAVPMFAQMSPQGQAVQMSPGMLVSQGGNGIVEEMPIEHIRALKAHNLHDVDEVVLVSSSLCRRELFFHECVLSKSVHACFVWNRHLPTNVTCMHQVYLNRLES